MEPGRDVTRPGRSRGEHEPGGYRDSAAAGRVAHLFVRPGASLRGRLDEQTFLAEIDRNGPDDLVDRAIADTLRNGGDVFALGEDNEDDMLMAAAYRYPT